MSVIKFNNQSIFGQGTDLIKIALESAIVNTTKTLVVSMNIMDGAEALVGKLAAEVTGEEVSLDDVRDSSKNIFCPTGKFVPSEKKEKQADSSVQSEKKEKEESSDLDKPLTKADALALIETMQQKNQENLILLLKEMMKEESK